MFWEQTSTLSVLTRLTHLEVRNATWILPDLSVMKSLTHLTCLAPLSNPNRNICVQQRGHLARLEHLDLTLDVLRSPFPYQALALGEVATTLRVNNHTLSRLLDAPSPVAMPRVKQLYVHLSGMHELKARQKLVRMRDVLRRVERLELDLSGTLPPGWAAELAPALTGLNAGALQCFEDQPMPRLWRLR